VALAGAVVRPGRHTFVEHQTLQDLIDQAGGLREDANDVEVSRRRVSAVFSDTTSIVTHFALVNGRMSPEAQRFLLERDDRVLVRSAPGFRQQKFAEVSGAFTYPASYAITENTDRVSDLIARSGGTLPGAYLRSGRLLRGGRIVAIDFEKALRGDNDNNVLLFGGDLLTISNDPGTVYVTGEVQRPALVKYERGFKLKDYLDRAGGLGPNADYDNLTVEDPSGLVQRQHKVGFVFSSEPKVYSGAIINVPTKPENKGTFRDTMTTIVQTASALASLAIAYLAVRK
jgi:protein involved in polysaccharide export with SLBB domain